MDGISVRAIRLKDAALGEYIKRSTTTDKVYIKGRFVRGKDYLGRTLNKYSCEDTEDISREIYLKGDTIVYIGFTY